MQLLKTLTLVFFGVNLDTAFDQIEGSERRVGDTTAENATKAAQTVILERAKFNFLCVGKGGLTEKIGLGKGQADATTSAHVPEALAMVS